MKSQQNRIELVTRADANVWPSDNEGLTYLDYAMHKVFGPRRFDARTENGQFGVRCAAGVKRVS